MMISDEAHLQQQALAKLCDLSQIDTVVVDAATTDEHRRQVTDAGCELIVAE